MTEPTIRERLATLAEKVENLNGEVGTLITKWDEIKLPERLALLEKFTTNHSKIPERVTKLEQEFKWIKRLGLLICAELLALIIKLFVLDYL